MYMFASFVVGMAAWALHTAASATSASSARRLSLAMVVALLGARAYRRLPAGLRLRGADLHLPLRRREPRSRPLTDLTKTRRTSSPWSNPFTPPSLIGAGLAMTGLIGAGAGLGILFGNYLQAAMRNPSAAAGERGDAVPRLRGDRSHGHLRPRDGLHHPLRRLRAMADAPSRQPAARSRAPAACRSSTSASGRARWSGCWSSSASWCCCSPRSSCPGSAARSPSARTRSAATSARRGACATRPKRSRRPRPTSWPRPAPAPSGWPPTPRRRSRPRRRKRQAEEEARLGQVMAEAEARIAAARTEAMTHVRGIAADTAEAIVARLTGQPAGAAEVERALERRGIAMELLAGRPLLGRHRPGAADRGADLAEGPRHGAEGAR